jgi:hypothetical protein
VIAGGESRYRGKGVSIFLMEMINETWKITYGK